MEVKCDEISFSISRNPRLPSIESSKSPGWNSNVRVYISCVYTLLLNVWQWLRATHTTVFYLKPHPAELEQGTCNVSTHSHTLFWQILYPRSSYSHHITLEYHPTARYYTRNSSTRPQQSRSLLVSSITAAAPRSSGSGYGNRSIVAA